MTLTSSAFAQGQPIPKRHTGEGEDSSPPLAWSNLPAATKELALIVDDPDAPSPQPWVHWVVYKLSPELTSLKPGLPRKAELVDPPGARQGTNSWPNDNLGYRGPMPPKGHGVHRYFFRLYALDQPLDLPPRATKDTLLDAMKGHILAEAELMGTYQR
ncbi:MAG: YbhB/YbcL family Raf kinase inhibitor-like protein [Phycisphaeraceae bacterium]|nr:YbhB/YbcL family Raf kinase inhibitor-like protein [Phycisphaeraceae bacterium]